MTISTATHGSVERPRPIPGIREDGPNAEFEALIPRKPANEAQGRWLDLCFRLIILALAALWLLTPPAGNERSAADEKAGSDDPMTDRQPESTAARIEPLATLPLFHKLNGRKVVLAGGTEGALWKAELLAAAGAELHVFADGDTALFAGLAQSEAGGRVHIHDRAWQADDLVDAAIAVADLDDSDAIRAFVAAARQAGVPVNIVDKPDYCDFAFGALVNRSPLVVAVSTDGAAPVFGQAIRTKIEALLPAGLKNWAQAAADWRPSVQARELPFALRRSFWELFAGKAMAEPERMPNLEDEAELFAKLSRIEAAHDGKGRVTLVGAGPGDPELLTLKAIRALQSADIILYDDLVSPGVLELARREAKRMLVGKTGYGPSVKQGDINALIVSLASQGKHVVRLKGGDPGIFGRAGEEIEACQAAGVPVAIVPGISAAQGAAASLGLSLTHRDHARRLQFVTGHSRKGELPDDLDWRAMADPAASTVIYMARATLPGFRERAIAAGLDPRTPAVAVLSATRPDEARVAATIATLPERLGELPTGGPVLVLLGHAFGPALSAANPAEDRRRA